MTASQPAPFIPNPPDESPAPSAPWRVLATPAYRRLWIAQVISSTGDWIGLIAILAIASRVSDRSAAAVSLVIAARVVPGFFLGTVGGVLIDRLDRRKVMLACDVGRAVLLALLPFVETLLGLVLVSFGLEILTLLWGPAKDASVPSLIRPEELTSANTFSLVASYATFPLASIVFSLLSATAGWLGAFEPLSGLRVDQEALALLFDAGTFLVSAFFVWRLPIPATNGRREHHERRRGEWTRAVGDIHEGLRFIGRQPVVRGIIIGLGLGIIGCGAMIPLGPVFAREGLGGDSAAFGVLMTALGLGAGIGVVLLLLFQSRLPRELVFELALIGAGALLVFTASVSSLLPAAVLVALVGACAGTAYVTGFTRLQETVQDEIRGRTFATLYTVIRLCLLLALVISPLWSDLWDWVIGIVVEDRAVTVAGVRYELPGVRLALWGGGLVTVVAGLWARHSVLRAERSVAAEAAEAAEAPGAAGAEEP